MNNLTMSKIGAFAESLRRKPESVFLIPDNGDFRLSRIPLRGARLVGVYTNSVPVNQLFEDAMETKHEIEAAA